MIFNVSITQFCGNLSADQERAAELILGHELLVMQQLDFHLTIHNLFRPLEGFLIDIKVNISLHLFKNIRCRTSSLKELGYFNNL